MRLVYHYKDGGAQHKIWTSTGPRVLRQHYKPILWHQRPNKPTGIRRKHPSHRRGGTRDLIDSGDPRQINNDHNAPDGHKWQQSVQGFERLIEAYTNQPDVICDPMVGSGTTILAGLNMGRHRLVGIDLDPDAIAKTKYRLRVQKASQVLS